MATLDVQAGATLAAAELQRSWRVRAGVLVVCQRSRDRGERPQYLALPGDLIGLEQMAGGPPPSRVQALAAATLVALPAQGRLPAPDVLVQALAQSRRQADELERLRCGALSERLLRLLLLLRMPRPAGGEVEMPTLKQLSQLIEATPEAICRALSQMKQAEVIVAQPDTAQPQRRLVRIAPPASWGLLQPQPVHGTGSGDVVRP